MASEPLKHTRSGSMVQNVAGLWSGAGSTRCMDISSNTPKVHGRVLRANPVTISHFLCVPHYYWDVGRPGLVSDPGPDLSTKWISPQIHKKYTGVYLRNNLGFCQVCREITAEGLLITSWGSSAAEGGYQLSPRRLFHAQTWQKAQIIPIIIYWASYVSMF